MKKIEQLLKFLFNFSLSSCVRFKLSSRIRVRKTDLQIEHGELIDCYYLDFGGSLEEYSEIRCDPGYEIQSNIFTLSVMLDKQNAYLKSPVICESSSKEFCSSIYPIPKDYDESNVSFVNVGSRVNSQYRVGTKITFLCKKGYYYYGLGDLFTTCLNDDQWSKVPSCIEDFFFLFVKFFPAFCFFACGLTQCWKAVPERPLNGRRDVYLELNKVNGDSSGSWCSFTCNPFYELTGPGSLSCVNGKWETNEPVCKLFRNICIKPPEFVNGASLISLSSTAIENELSFEQRIQHHQNVLQSKINRTHTPVQNN